MLLDGKTAVVYGAGSIGTAVASAFAAAGARVYLASRTEGRLVEAARQIRAASGTVQTEVLDATDEAAVDAHARSVVTDSGRLDISMNVISHGDVQGTPLAKMSLADFEQVVHTAVRTTFLTARAAARQMITQKSGVILLFGGYGPPAAGVGGLQVAFGALESLRRALACELGPDGIRVVTLQTGGIPETLPPDFAGRQAITDSITGATMLGRPATLADVGRIAVFAASDHAAPITGSAINITAGATPG